uniref:Xylanolytic transcriptional activator regulatory domain-containing protein n=1 Tax=Bionectria ochroleuca TaxID=29856 RepID=A0A0B7KJR3_BIOOC
MRFIHQPTFFSANAPNTVLFPMCLIGLLLLDPTRTRHFVTIKLSYAMEKCNASLSRDWVRSDSVGLVTNLASAVLLLSAAASIEEMVSSSITYALYTKALSVAQQHSLFEVEKGTPLSLESLGDRSDVDAWEAWARAESTKRMICCMIMVDSFFAANLGTSPIIRLDTLKLYAPCATYLFAADDAGRWSQLDTSRSFARQVTVENDVDWGKVGNEGLPDSDVSRPTQDPAAHFIRSGGQVKFAGMRLPGGFGSARKVILEYVGLLEEVGKWKAGEFCRILRTLSDSPVDLDP